MTAHELTPFRRGLSPGFMDWLAGDVGCRLLALFDRFQLDVRLRNNYLNAYRAQSSVARVRWLSGKRIARVEIDRAYLERTRLLLNNKKIQKFDVSDEFLDLYERELPRIRSTVDNHYASPEGVWEAKCMRANRERSSFQIVDRQIANSRPPLRLDVLAVSTEGEAPAVLATELKRDLDSRIQHVPVQLARYLDMLDPGGRGLRGDVAESYRLVCEQLRTLGRNAPDPRLIHPGMDVIGLVALANYNPKSALLGRALEKAGALERRIHFCFLGTNGVVPPSSRWFVAASSQVGSTDRTVSHR
jgi:hypothetical protein